MTCDTVLFVNIDRTMIGTGGLNASDKYEPTNERLPCPELYYLPNTVDSWLPNAEKARSISRRKGTVSVPPAQ